MKQWQTYALRWNECESFGERSAWVRVLKGYARQYEAIVHEVDAIRPWLDEQGIEWRPIPRLPRADAQYFASLTEDQAFAVRLRWC